MYNRSYHFIPANKPKLFERCASIGADRYVFDLEDAVPETEKLDALASISDWLETQSNVSDYYVRLNGCESEIARDECDLLKRNPDVGVVLPKIDSREHLQAELRFYDIESSRRTIGLIESFRGLTQLSDILASQALEGVGLGLEDFLSESIYSPGQVMGLVQSIRSKIALAALEYGIDVIDTISTDFTSEGEQLLEDALNARSAGMTAKFTIHPNQVSNVNECFAPECELISKALTHQHWIVNITPESTGYFKYSEEVFSPPKIKKLKKVVEWIEATKHSSNSNLRESS